MQITDEIGYGTQYVRRLIEDKKDFAFLAYVDKALSEDRELTLF